MRSETFMLDTQDETPVFVHRWLPDGEPKSVVQIAHGMAEHSARYERFAQALTDAGYAVYAGDHRGHGKSVKDARDVGYFADDNGFDRVVDDMHALTERIENEQPDVPVVLFGHSMGSFLSRSYATRFGADIDALVISGTGGSAGPLGKIGRGIAGAQARLRGRRHPSGLMNTLTFGQYNARFKPARTDFDWLSRDPEEVDKYIADPKCGELFTVGFYADLLAGLERVNDDKEVAAVPSDLPILLISGSDDPVGGKNADGVRAVGTQLRKLGVREVTTTIYPGARHELLNETNRDEVTADVIAWLDKQVTAAKP